MSNLNVSFLMWIGGILLMVIGFFVSFYFTRSIKKQDENSKSIAMTHLELSASINKLQIAITGLNAVILSMQEKNDIFTSGCRDKHSVIDTRLNDHGKRLNEHERKIVELDTKINQG